VKKKTETERNLALSLFGDNPPKIKIVLDESAPKPEQAKAETMDAGDANCACE